MKEDFFPEINEIYDHLVVPHEPVFYQETEDDRLREEDMSPREANISGPNTITPGDDWGDLPFDAAADQQRWNELEAEFNSIFDAGQQIF